MDIGPQACPLRNRRVLEKMGIEEGWIYLEDDGGVTSHNHMVSFVFVLNVCYKGMCAG